MPKNFRLRNFEDFEIVENGQVVGQIRVKPSGVLWSPRGSHSWFRVSLDQFATFAEERGTKQKK